MRPSSCRARESASLRRTLSRAARALGLGVFLCHSLSAADLPTHFTESVFINDFPNGTTMRFAPDGRLFVCTQDGQVRVVKNGALLPTPALTVETDTQGEHGLVGIAFDPEFVDN